MDEMEKLSILLFHWIEHTKEHAEEYLNWAKRLEELGYTEIARELKDSSQILMASEERLSHARELLGNRA